jgi:hypothetical protein
LFTRWPLSSSLSLSLLFPTSLCFSASLLLYPPVCVFVCVRYPTAVLVVSIFELVDECTSHTRKYLFSAEERKEHSRIHVQEAISAEVKKVSSLGSNLDEKMREAQQISDMQTLLGLHTAVNKFYEGSQVGLGGLVSQVDAVIAEELRIKETIRNLDMRMDHFTS